MRGLYIHIPFCSGKCHYCDFISFPDKADCVEDYLDAVEKEMRFYTAIPCDTLYIGGGTPSELSAQQLRRLFKSVDDHFGPVCDFSESTFEANPESLTQDKIMLLRQYGMKRVSVGLQSFNADVLRNLGRRHTVERFLDAYLDLRQVGFTNINVDLMCAVPGQTREVFAEDLARLIKLGPEHVSVYGLQVEEGTRFAADGVAEDGDLTREYFDLARAELSSAGYAHYEISNFAKPGMESLHNLNYWENGEYIGIGCSATSYLSGVRKTNAPMLEHYCSSMLTGEDMALASCEKLAGKEKTGETMMLGLRKLGGMSLTPDMKADFGRELASLSKRGLISLEDDRARLTEEGVYISNEVFRCFVPPFD